MQNGCRLLCIKKTKKKQASFCHHALNFKVPKKFSQQCFQFFLRGYLKKKATDLILWHGGPISGQMLHLRFWAVPSNFYSSIIHGQSLLQGVPGEFCCVSSCDVLWMGWYRNKLLNSWLVNLLVQAHLSGHNGSKGTHNKWGRVMGSCCSGESVRDNQVLWSCWLSVAMLDCYDLSI